MFELSEVEEDLCDLLVEDALATAVNWIFETRECGIAEVQNEVRIRMIGALEMNPYNTNPDHCVCRQ